MTWTDQDRAYADVFDRAMNRHPRTLQRAVGPSQIGVECDRALLHALAGEREPVVPYAGWMATVGTSVHAWAAEAFEEENRRLGRVRYVVERKVMVGSYAGRDVWGTVDCYDVDSREVVDLKTASKSSMRRHLASVGRQHEVQRACYGLAFDRLGLTPVTVANWYVPRDGNLTDSFVQRVPYDPAPAVEALERAGRLQVVLDGYGGDAGAAGAGYEPCGSAWCHWCPRDAGKSLFDR